MPFGVDEVRPAVVAIDLHRGHLDPSVATLPVRNGTEDAIITANRQFLDASRRANVPVIHCVTQYLDPVEIRANPYWHAHADQSGNARRNQERHNLTGSPGIEIIPQLHDPGYDLVISAKRRYNCFVATDLDFMLTSRGINTVVLTGVNTNSCVLATATAACSLDYAVIVVDDCVESMDGLDLHRAALMCIDTAFGWVKSSTDVIRVLRGARNDVPR